MSDTPAYTVFAWRAPTAEAAAFKAQLEAEGHVNMVPDAGLPPRRFSDISAVFAVAVATGTTLTAPAGFEAVDPSLARQFSGF